MTHNDVGLPQNVPVEIYTYPLNRVLCWHSRSHLRRLGTSNGADIYCTKCGRKRFAYLTNEESA
jgi:hypothetical protein